MATENEDVRIDEIATATAITDQSKTMGLDDNGNVVMFPLSLLTRNNIGEFKTTDAAPIAPPLLNQNYKLIGTAVGQTPSGTYTNLLMAAGTPLVIPAAGSGKAIINAYAVWKGAYYKPLWDEIATTAQDLSGYVATTDMNKTPSNQMFDPSHLIVTGFDVSGYRNDSYIRSSDGALVIGGVAVGWQIAHIIVPAGTTKITVSGLITATSKAWRFTDAAGNLISGQFGTATATTQTFDVPAAVNTSGGCMDINVKRSDEAGTAKDTVMINLGPTALPYEVYTAGFVNKIKGYNLLPDTAKGLAAGNVVPTPAANENAANKLYVDTALASKANAADLSLVQANDMTQANLVPIPAASIYTYNVDGGKNVVVSGITGSTTVWDVVWSDNTTKFTFEYGNGRMWAAIGYSDSSHVAVIGCCQSGNLTGNVVNVDKTTNTFVTKDAHGLASLVAGDTLTLERNGDALILSKNGAVLLTYSIAALLALGVTITNIRFGVALFNSNGTAVTNGSTVAKKLKSYSTVLLKDYVLSTPPVNNLKDIPVAFITDSIGTTLYGGNTDQTLYHGLMVSRYGIRKFVDAIAGTAIGGTASDRLSAPARWGALGSTFGNANLMAIVIQGITNDFRARGVDLGDINTTDSTTTYGALKLFYQGLQDTYLNAKIFHINGLHRRDTTIDPGVFPEQYTRSAGPPPVIVKLADYNKAIDDVARIYGVRVVDVFQKSGLSYSNMIPGGSYTSDGLHPNPAGQYRMFEVLANDMNNAFKI